MTNILFTPEQMATLSPAVVGAAMALDVDIREMHREGEDSTADLENMTCDLGTLVDALKAGVLPQEAKTITNTHIYLGLSFIVLCMFATLVQMNYEIGGAFLTLIETISTVGGACLR